ncbi:Crp/Fnr family transcriptional regulator [Halalkalibacterium halodurans]|uniref:Crp/Fnr family transcriptional regulator n=1 Tax=Halalkalibacterium halodurans TaxID=86665 RepID=UPI002AA9B883|nr:Crp/Fnr family transcriptional regulator [Halalkalibacterium halodurans]MDY7220747.1 Crp/Fnr family transcriptional regulator [Halalkalibacterium halodurans]MDY7239986.1 Crp/Fnr family transcriptional regulator [Halalkalibacterium halodurans]
MKAYKIDEAGNEQVISLLRDGEMFPHVGFFDRSPYPVTVEVLQHTELVVIRVDDFDELLCHDPQLTMKLMQIMGSKIIELQERIQSFISKDVQHRLAHALINLAAERGVKKGDGVYIQLPITNQDFANLIGTSRERLIAPSMK